jgi:hypothetical protein
MEPYQSNPIHAIPSYFSNLQYYFCIKLKQSKLITVVSGEFYTLAYSPSNVKLGFGDMYRLHIQGSKAIHVGYNWEADS